MLNATDSPISRNRYRSILISNAQLGTRGSKTLPLPDFLVENTCDHLIFGWRYH